MNVFDPNFLLPAGSVGLAELAASEYFAARRVDDCFTKRGTTMLRPIDPINSHEMQFQMKPSMFHFFDLGQLCLEMKVKLCRLDNDEAPAAGSQVSPINNILHSLIDTCYVALNGKRITYWGESYAYRAYLYKLINYDKTRNESEGWYDDSIGCFKNETNNRGHEKRRLLFKGGINEEGKVTFRDDGITFVSNLVTDFIQIRKLIVPRTGLKVQLKFTPPEFHIWTSEAKERFRLKVVDAALHILTFEPSLKFAQEMERRLSASPCIYEFEQWTPITFKIEKDLVYFESPDFSRFTRARKIYCFFTMTSQSQNQNPYDLRRMWLQNKTLASSSKRCKFGEEENKEYNCKIEQCDLMVNGERLHRFSQQDNNFEHNVSLEYYKFISISGAYNLPKDLYQSNAAIWAWDLGLSSKCAPIEVDPHQGSNPIVDSLNILVKFSPKNLENLTCHIFALSNETFSLAHDGTVLTSSAAPHLH